jgi:hypothetical protein
MPIKSSGAIAAGLTKNRMHAAPAIAFLTYKFGDYRSLRPQSSKGAVTGYKLQVTSYRLQGLQEIEKLP